MSLSKYRTLIGALSALVALELGIYFVAQENRDTAFTPFAVAVVGVVSALAGKGAIQALGEGEGVKGAKAVLMTSARPGA